MVANMTAFEFLKQYPYLPHSVEHKKGRPSNSEVWRWLDSGSVIINGKNPKPHDKITFPITELVFFPRGKRKTTMV